MVRIPRLPTSRDDFRLVLRTTRLVLSTPLYGALGVGFFLVGLNLFVVAQNFALFVDVVLLGNSGAVSRLSVLLGLYPLVGTAYTVTQSVLLYAIAVLFGVNLSLLTYHFREHGVSVEEGSSGAVGIVLGVLGAGCAACGSAVLAGLLSVFGVAGTLTFLPLDGLEFSLLSVAVLVVSVYWVADGMRGGEIRGCPVDV